MNAVWRDVIIESHGFCSLLSSVARGDEENKEQATRWTFLACRPFS